MPIGPAQASSVEDLARAFRIVATELPFGGMKESGHGSEGGAEGISHYLTNKFISQAWERPTKPP